MRPVSDRFRRAINQGYRPAVEAKVLRAGQDPFLVEVLAGSTVTLDATADSRGSTTMTAPHALAPLADSDPLTPYGNEIQISRGIDFDGELELVSLGIFKIDTILDSGTGFSFTAVDRSIRIIEADFEESFNVASRYAPLLAPCLIPDAIKGLILDAYPECEFGTWATTTMTVPASLSVSEGDSRWEACQVLALAMGCDVYFDGRGRATLTPTPVATAAPVAKLTEGNPDLDGDGGNLTDAQRSWTSADAKNRWIVTGNATETDGSTPRGVATDDDPASPTRYSGPFGKKPDFYSNENIVTDAQAAYVAEVRKFKNRGIAKSAPFDCLVNPAIEPLDVARLTRLDAGLDENVIIDQISIPLDDGTMSGSTRSALIQ